MSGRGRGTRGRGGFSSQPSGPSSDGGAGFASRGRGGGVGRGGFGGHQNGDSSISDFNSYKREQGPIQGQQAPTGFANATGFGNAQQVNFDSGHGNFDRPGRGRGGGGRGGRGRGGGRGDFGGGGAPNGNRGFDNVAGGEKDEFGRPRNANPDYQGQTYKDEELFNNLSFSGLNLNEQDKIPVNVSDLSPVAESEKITQQSCYRPTFESMGLAPQLLANIKKLQWSNPTPIQKHACSILMEGRDVMACAQTGSGKTGAMLIPMINYLISQQSINPRGGPSQEVKGVIVAPTRELATQIYLDALRLANNTGVLINVAYGGTSTRAASSAIWKGTSILIGTPGRMADFLDKRVFLLKECEFFFLDEADRMLDMGFRPQIDTLVHELPEQEMRTMAMFSATMPVDIQKMASDMLNKYVFMSVGVVGAANSDIKQEFHILSRKEKLFKCADIIKKLPENEKILVFVGSKIFADTMATMLGNEPYHIKSTALHGDRCQEDRDRAIRDFKNGTHRVLVATSVAARGLDVKDISTVVNYDMPQEISEYIHRIGRTARIGNKGRAITFLEERRDNKYIPDLISILKDANQEIPAVLQSASGGSFGGGASHWGGGSSRPQEDHREYAQFDAANARGPVDVTPVEIKEFNANQEEDDW